MTSFSLMKIGLKQKCKKTNKKDPNPGINMGFVFSPKKDKWVKVPVSVGGYSKRVFYVVSNPIWQQILGKNKSLLKLQFCWRHWTITSNPQPQLQAAHRQQGPEIWILNEQSFFLLLWPNHRIIARRRLRWDFNLVLGGVSMIQTGHEPKAQLLTS